MQVELYLGEIITHEDWAGRWFIDRCHLGVGSESGLTDPNSIPTFVLAATMIQMSWDLALRNEKRITVEFGDPLELAMRLSEYKLVNADHVIRAVKARINQLTE